MDVDLVTILPGEFQVSIAAPEGNLALSNLG